MNLASQVEQPEDNNSTLGAICNYSSTVFLYGIPVTFDASYVSSASCDPCFTSSNYGRISIGGFTLDEGAFSTLGLGIACQTNMQHCPA